MLSRLLLRTLFKAIQESEKIVDGLSDQDDEKVIRTTVLRHGQLLSLIHQLTHLISTSVGDDVPRWAIQPMKFEVRKYLRESVDILIVGGDEGGNFAYDYRLDGLKSVLTAALGERIASRITKDLPNHMAVFHFPFGERDNVLAHGAFFHEVAHQIDIGIRGISERVTQSFLQKRDKELREGIRRFSEPLIQQLSGRGKKETDQRSLEDEQVELLLETLTKSVQKVLFNWSREFCADLLATRILGPAYAVVVVISPALLTNLRVHSSTHPATLLRLKIILDLLGSDKAGNFFVQSESALERAGILELLVRWREQSARAKHPQMRWITPLDLFSPELYGALVRWGEALAGEILAAVVDETLDQIYYTPNQYTSDILQVLPNLEQWITINESIDYVKRTHKPNSISTIYNVGVARYLQEDQPEGRARLANLLRKSIELSQVQQVLGHTRPLML